MVEGKAWVKSGNGPGSRVVIFADNHPVKT